MFCQKNISMLLAALDTVVAYYAKLGREKYLYVPTAAIERVTTRNDVSSFRLEL